MIKKLTAAILVAACVCSPLGGFVSRAHSLDEPIQTNFVILSDMQVPPDPPPAEPTFYLSSLFTSALADRIYTGLLNFSDSIDLSGLIIRDSADYINIVKASMSAVINSSPELFHTSEYDFSYEERDGQRYISSIEPVYTMTPTEYNDAKIFIDHKVSEIIAGMDKSFGALEKVLYAHDWLAARFAYDMRVDSDDEDEYAQTVYDIYGFFTQNTGASQAYAKAFAYVMSAAKVPCYIALNEAEKHTWNIVTIGGQNYHVDVSCDDRYTNDDFQNEYDMLSRIEHTYFLLSDNTICDTEYHGNWYTLDYFYGKDIYCGNASYEDPSYVWSGCFTPFTYCGGNWYYIKYEQPYSLLYSTSRNFLDAISVARDTPKWYLGRQKIDGYFGGLFSFGDYVCYSTADNIQYYDTKSGDMDVFAEFPYTGQALGCVYDNRGNITVALNSGYADYDTYRIEQMGDVNADYEIDALDLTIMRRYMVTGECDYNWGYLCFSGSADVSVLDLIKMKKFIVGQRLTLE